jgi:lipoprotein-releasing system permease protein
VSFETRIGWRYLYGGQRDPLMSKLAIGAGLVALIGLGVLVAAPGNPIGVLTFVLGLLMTAVFLMLSVFSVFTSVSVLGVAFGVAALTVVLAVTSGFQREFRDKVLGVNAHVIITKQQQLFGGYRDIMKTAREIDPDVISAQPFIFAEMLATRGKGELSGVEIKGVDPMLVREVLDLKQHITEGSIDSLAATGDVPGIIVGKELALKLKAKLGDIITIVVPLSNIDFDTFSATQSAPRTRRFKVGGIFYSGFDEYDRRLVYTSLAETQSLVGRGDEVFGVELKIKDVDRASEIARKLEKVLDSEFTVQDWYELNKNLFTALKLQKLVLVILLTLIILVASVNMVSALIMMVTDKTREIAILKSMGATSGSVGRVFVTIGLVIGGVGMAIGVSVGLAMCFVVSRYGYRLDPKVYLIDRLPIDVHPMEVVFVAAVTMVVAVIATIVPATNASSLRPVEGLRYD